MTEENKLIVGNVPGIFNNKASRRKVLKAALGAGALTTASGLSLASAADMPTQPIIDRPDKSATDAGRVRPLSTVGGQSWQVIDGMNFRPRESSTGFTYYGAGVAYATGNAGTFSYRLTLPDGAKIIAFRAYVYQNAAGSSLVQLVSNQVFNQNFQSHSEKLTSTTSTTYQTLANYGSAAAPLAVIDNFNRSYSLLWTPGGVGSDFRLAGFEIGWVGPVGNLNTLTVPSRFMDTRPSSQVGPLTTLAPNSTNNFVLGGATGVTQPGVVGSPTVTIPGGATAVVGNVTIVAPQASGRLKINPGGTNSSDGTGVITWVGSSGNTLSYSNSFNAALVGGYVTLSLFCPVAVDVVIDIVGYYF